jgi:hypothetical protein
VVPSLVTEEAGAFSFLTQSTVMNAIRIGWVLLPPDKERAHGLLFPTWQCYFLHISQNRVKVCSALSGYGQWALPALSVGEW